MLRGLRFVAFRLGRDGPVVGSQPVGILPAVSVWLNVDDDRFELRARVE